MSLSPMSHVEFKKVPCRPVDFRGQGPYHNTSEGYRVRYSLICPMQTLELNRKKMKMKAQTNTKRLNADAVGSNGITA